jgi:hypothetical protein
MSAKRMVKLAREVTRYSAFEGRLRTCSKMHKLRTVRTRSEKTGTMGVESFGFDETPFGLVG